MRSTKITLGVALVLVMFMASFSLAENVPPPKLECQENFKTMDVNNDQTLSKQEFMAAPHGHMKDPEHMFSSWDANGDKSLDLDEFCAHAGKGMGRAEGMTGGKGMKKRLPY